MNDEHQIEALLQRLVRQFASPYDFVRELVQNSMDAGSDLVDCFLHTHPGHRPDEVVFELEFSDTGEGMDEQVIDTELTRLFSSGKSQDRTMAGGFGIGFVSVFAWDPERVLVQTGRRDESWELLFGADRRFVKRRVDEPFEGTTIRLFRRGRMDERPALAAAVRDALWRWCRYVPIEVTFEDVEAGTGPEAIADAPTPPDAVVMAEVREGPSTIVASFAVPPRAVLLRHGLILAEGTAAEHLLSPALRGTETLEHLRVWADSPRLRTSLARDKVIDDEGRTRVEADVLALVERLRSDLLDRVEAMARGAGEWDEARHAAFAHLHAHLRCEHAALTDVLPGRPVLRSAAGVAVSAMGLAGRARAQVVAVVPPGPMSAEQAGVRLAAGRCGVPAVVGRWPEDRDWIAPIVQSVGLRALPVHEAVSRVEDPQQDGGALASLVERLLAAAGLDLQGVALGRFTDAQSLCGIELGHNVVLHAPPLPARLLRGRRLVLDVEHPLVHEAAVVYPRLPDLATFTLAAAIMDRLEGVDISADRLADRLDDLAPAG